MGLGSGSLRGWCLASFEMFHSVNDPEVFGFGHQLAVSVKSPSFALLTGTSLALFVDGDFLGLDSVIPSLGHQLLVSFVSDSVFSGFVHQVAAFVGSGDLGSGDLDHHLAVSFDSDSSGLDSEVLGLGHQLEVFTDS
jgi:hypothetical protein